MPVLQSGRKYQHNNKYSILVLYNNNYLCQFDHSNLDKFSNTVLGTLIISDIINATTVTDTFSDSETMSTKAATTNVTLSPSTVYITVGGIFFSTTVTDTFSDSETISTNIMTIFAATTNVTLSPSTVYIIVGGIFFFLIVMAVLGVIAGLLVRRVKHNVVTKQLTLSDMTSKSSKQGPSAAGTSNFKLKSPTQEATPLEGTVKAEFKEVELDGEHGPCLTRQSASPTSKPVPTHHDQDTTVLAQGSTEQLYVCPILSNVCELETANQ